MDAHPHADVITVRLQRDYNGLGFIVSSGDQRRKRSSKGVYVSAIVEGGSADRDGQLSIGDRILSINGIIVDDYRHREVVNLLTSSKPHVQLVVQRDASITSDPTYPAGSSTSDSEATSADYFLTPRKSSINSRHKDRHKIRSNSESANIYSQPAEVTPRCAEPSIPTIPAPALPEATPNPLHFPHPPTELGKFRETITKQTLTETVVTRHTSNQKGQFPVITEDVAIHKTIGSRLGLRIAGGIDSSCVPFGAVEKGIFISRVIANGIAARTQRLRIGDRIVRINGKNVTGFTHAEAIRALSDPNPQMILTVRHDPPPEGLQELLIQRKDGEQYGIKIIGGLRTHESYQKVYDSGIFVASIHRGGVIGRDGHLKVGMRLLEVNGTNLIGVTSKEAIDAFTKVGHILRLLVCDGWNRNRNNILTSDVEERSVQFSPSPPLPPPPPPPPPPLSSPMTTSRPKKFVQNARFTGLQTLSENRRRWCENDDDYFI